MSKGNGVSPGIGIAQALVWQPPVAFDYVPRKCADPDLEVERFEAARRAVLNRTGHLRERTARFIGHGEAVIFEAHSLILDDEEELLEPLRARIREERFSAEYAVTAQFDVVARELLAMEDDYMRQRVDDVLGLRDGLIRELVGQQAADLSHLDRPTVVVAQQLSATDVVGLDISRLAGVICETGGYSSHVSIILRTLGVPAVMGLPGLSGRLQTGDLIALDGESGEVWIEPGEEEIHLLRARGDALAERRAEAQRYRGRATVTLDGRRVELMANVGHLDEVETARHADAECLGLFRTELLHQEGVELPGEEAQFEVYRAVLNGMQGKAVTVRTYDGGPNLPGAGRLPQREDNPVMGNRGIRLCLGRPSFFRTQLRALLRASAYGSLKIMFPMVCNLDELCDALDALQHVKAELVREGVTFDDKLPVGVDVEVPSAALMSEAFARKVDFLSIGINDLIQFTLALDRGNPDLGHLYHQFHPAVLRLVQHTVDAAHKHGIPCILCGEAPGQEKALPLFLGMGIDGFSMNPGMILNSRRILNNCSYEKSRALAQEILQMDSPLKVAKRLSGFSAPG